MARQTTKTTKQAATKVDSKKAVPAKKVTAASMRQVKKQIDQQLAPVAAKLAGAENGSLAEKSTQVDSHVPGNASYEVVVDGEKVYSIYMMWSDTKNNHNKYYIVQVLRRKGTEQYSTWIRYGRVGMVADKTLQPSNKQGSIGIFNKKTNEKLRKGYTEIKMALGASDADGAAGGSTTKSTKCDVVIEDSTIPSKLDATV